MDEEAPFAAALERPTAAERATFLNEACGSDVGLRRRVEQLLVAHEMAAGVLERRPDALTMKAGATSAVGAGTIIGRYKLIELIGEGGMGDVWMAEQREPVKRLVALKLIKAGRDSRLVMARFDAERQALALMDHPNIAKIFDGGLTENSSPYFVMELVKGTSITKFCDERRLSPRGRLELFIPVCEAIQHAHQKGVIHRDIKPNNVLIGLYDGRPVPKIIDFGIAKATGPELTELTLHTNFGTVVGTPQYMSPEQAETNQLDIDTRSDIYSLGVMLYELLTGTTPVEKATLGKAAILEVLRIIRDVEPPNPSTRLSSADALPSIAANRNIEPRSLTAMIRGELDWIVMKSLEKDRSRRYATVNGLTRDIERYLAGEPVEAGAPGAVYRLRKFVRRHKAVMATGAAFSLLLLLGAAVSAWQAVRATKAEHIATAERNTAIAEKERADTEAAIALAVNQFLQKDLLGQADVANQAVGKERVRDITVRELLDRAALDVESKFKNHPKTEAAIRQTLGNAYRAIGQYPEAQKHLERSLELQKKQQGEHHSDTLNVTHAMADLLTVRGEFEAAERQYNAVLDNRRASLGEVHPDTLRCMNDLGILLKLRGRLEEAESILKTTLDARRSELGDDHLDTLETTSCLASLLYAKGRYFQAEPLFKRVLSTYRGKLGADHPRTLRAAIELSVVYVTWQRFSDAEPLLNEALAGYRRTRGPDHPDTLDAMHNLSELYEETGRLDEAESLNKQVMDFRRAKQGADHPETLASMQHFASTLYARGRFDEASALFKQVLASQRAKLGGEHPETIVSLHNLAVLFRDTNRSAEAEPMFREALAAARATWGLSHVDTHNIVANFAMLHLNQGTPQLAEPLLREVVAFLKDQPGPGSFAYANQLGYLAQILLAQKKYAEADPVARECLTIRTKNGPDRWTTFYTQHLLGTALCGQKKFADAEPLLVGGYDGMKRREDKIPAAGKHHLVAALNGVIKLYDEWDKKPVADEWRTKVTHAKP